MQAEVCKGGVKNHSNPEYQADNTQSKPQYFLNAKLERYLMRRTVPTATQILYMDL